MPRNWRCELKAPARTLVIDADSTLGLRSLAAELLEFRDLLWVMVVRDIKIRYKQTVLGASWAVLQPLLTMLIFTVVFGRLAKLPSDGIPYPVYVFAGLVPWTLFANSVIAASNSLVGSNHLISKVYFPRILVPLSSVFVFALDALVASVVLVGLMLWYGYIPGLTILLLPLVVFGVLISALGVGIFLSAFTVTYRDFRYVTPFMVQIWMFVTPVVYPASLVDEKFRWIFGLNPVAGFVEVFRWVCLGKPVDPVIVVMSFSLSVAIVYFAVVYFQRVERRFADVI